MKINKDIPQNSTYKQWCILCGSENIQRKILENGNTKYFCNDCNQLQDRMIVIDPLIKWWIDPVTRDYWHESVGIFIFNNKNEILLFKRTIFPFAYTVPAGHLDINEDVYSAIKREVREETGISHIDVTLFANEDISGDECRRGCDHHKWYLFVSRFESDFEVTISDEGIEANWMSINDTLKVELTYPVRYFLEKYNQSLIPNEK
ncbi:NUDIX domain-containing protein [Candidatus Falkowbacteria bacterium]|nr:NUDIX domain-containing protein [Candidatus Falkowbacteria bacterium]